MVIQQAVKTLVNPLSLFYKSLTGAPAAKTPAQLLVGAKGAAPVATLPQQSAYQKIASGVYGIKDAASGRIVTTGVKVGVGTGIAGAGLAATGYGISEIGKPFKETTDTIDNIVVISGSGNTVLSLAAIGIIILVLIMVIKR